MVKLSNLLPRSNTSDNCPSCDIYRARIKELEEINDMHRKVNGELREQINNNGTGITWNDMIMRNDTEKK